MDVQEQMRFTWFQYCKSSTTGARSRDPSLVPCMLCMPCAKSPTHTQSFSTAPT